MAENPGSRSLMSTPQNSSYRHYLRSLGGRRPDTQQTEAITTPNFDQESDTEEEVTFCIKADSTMASQVHMNLFHGNPGDRADLWLKEFMDYCTFHGINADRRKTSFQFYLSGHAKQWFWSLADHVRQDFDEVLTQFKTRFNGSDVSFNLSSIRQRSSESVSEYLTRFLSATNNRGLPESLLVNFFVDGLVEHVKCVVMPQELSTLDQARLAALRAERTFLSTTASVASASQTNVEALSRKMDMLADIFLRHQTSQPQQTWTQQQNDQRPTDTQSNQGKGRKFSKSKNLHCDFCNKDNHTVAKCILLKSVKELGIEGIAELARRYFSQ